MLSVNLAMEANKSIGMMVVGVMMRPVHERPVAPMRYVLPADFNSVARQHRDPRREGDVVHHFQRSLCVATLKASCIQWVREPKKKRGLLLTVAGNVTSALRPPAIA